MASEPARARLLWAMIILSLVLPVTSGQFYCMPQSSPDFLCSHLFRHETFHPLFRRLAPFPLVLGCIRPLVGFDTESSEVVRETPHPLSSFPWTPNAARAPYQFKSINPEYPPSGGKLSIGLGGNIIGCRDKIS